MKTTTIEASIGWDEVHQLCATLGLEVHNVSLLVIEPWGITATCYLSDAAGQRYLDERGLPASTKTHFPRRGASHRGRDYLS